MRVSELAQRTGVSAHRLRRYEDQGMIRAERSGSGYREFGDRTVREVVFISMSRDLGFSLQQIANALPRYRSGTLTVDEMVHSMRERIAEVDAVIAEHRVLRKKLVSHIGWLEKRRREAGQRKPSTTPVPWSRSRKAAR